MRIFHLPGVMCLVILISSFNTVTIVRPDTHYKMGSVVTYVTVAPDRTVRSTTSTITGVTVTGNTTRFTFKSVYINEVGDTGRVDYEYYFMNKKNYWHQLKGSYYSIEGATETMAGDSMVFPFDMKIGDSLAPCFRNNSWTSKVSSGTDNNFFFNRRVTATDTILTRMGKIAAFRIEYKNRRYHKYTEPGGKQNEEITQIIQCQTWFSPEYGIIKWTYEDENGSWKTTLQSIR